MPKKTPKKSKQEGTEMRQSHFGTALAGEQLFNSLKKSIEHIMRVDSVCN